MTTEQFLFFLKWIIVVLNCEIKTWRAISYCNICHVAEQHCVFWGFFSKYYRWHVSFPLFSRKEPEEWTVGDEVWEFITSKSGKQDAVTRFLSTILVPVTVIFAHKGYQKTGQHVAFSFSITNYGFTSNHCITLQRRGLLLEMSQARFARLIALLAKYTSLILPTKANKVKHLNLPGFISL